MFRVQEQTRPRETNFFRPFRDSPSNMPVPWLRKWHQKDTTQFVDVIPFIVNLNGDPTSKWLVDMDHHQILMLTKGPLKFHTQINPLDPASGRKAVWPAPVPDFYKESPKVSDWAHQSGCMLRDSQNLKIALASSHFL